MKRSSTLVPSNAGCNSPIIRAIFIFSTPTYTVGTSFEASASPALDTVGSISGFIFPLNNKFYTGFFPGSTPGSDKTKIVTLSLHRYVSRKELALASPIHNQRP